jgi:predicted cupin superfamily sugar epimerase
VPGGRAHSTLIYYLLEAGDRSAWHRVDSAEIWHWYAGAPLELLVDRSAFVLGNDFAAGQRPQGIVPRHAWQSARSLGEWTLVGCTVAPGFEFAHFELAPPGWKP